MASYKIVGESIGGPPTDRNVQANQAYEDPVSGVIWVCTQSSPSATWTSVPFGQSGAYVSASDTGAWQATHAYTVGQSFTNAGTRYVVTTAYTSGGSFGSTDTTNTMTFGGSSVNYPNSSGTATVAPRPGVVFDVRDYGAKCDCQTFGGPMVANGGAGTNGSAVLADTTNTPFQSTDIGKVIVINNWLGAGTHFYGTISGFTDSGHVTVSGNCTNGSGVSNTPYTFGTDDTTAIQAAANAAVGVNGRLQLGPTPSVITATITFNGGCTAEGSSMVPMFGPDTTAPTNLLGQTLPIIPPYLAGSVLAVFLDMLALNGGYPFNSTAVIQSAAWNSTDSFKYASTLWYYAQQ